MDIVQFTPITEFRILKNVKINSSYEHTFAFRTVEEQTSFFIGKTAHVFTNMKPVNMVNAVRVPLTADTIYDCNYVMFKNANFNNRYFYGFISEIEWININMCLVHFEIDVIQTFLLYCTINPCMVQREHVNDDIAGHYLEPEPVDTGAVISDAGVTFGNNDGYCVMIQSTENIGAGNIAHIEPSTNQKLFSGLYLDFFTPDAPIKDFLDEAIAGHGAESVVSISMFPRDYVNAGGSVVSKVKQFNKPTTLNGYVPKNKKLLTFPYSYCTVDNSQGNFASFRYEFFNQNVDYYTLTTKCAMSSTPEIICFPDNYRGSVGENYLEKFSLSGFPLCPWTSEIFYRWMSQNESNLAMSVLGSTLGLAGSAATGNVVGAISSTGGLISTATEVRKVAETPPQSHGQQAPSTIFALDRLQFTHYHVSINEEYAKSIDDFFTMYGYAVNRLKVPNIFGRQNWNFVQCTTSNIIGNAPFDAIAKINQIFKNGITFWHSDNVGNYNLSNEVI